VEILKKKIDLGGAWHCWLCCDKFGGDNL